MLSRTFINVWMAPRIIGYRILHVRTLPVLRITRLHNQILKSVLAFRIIAVVHLEGIERRAERRDLRLRGSVACLLSAA